MNKALTAPLDPKIADRLLDLLSTDDLFRQRFQNDHIAALQSIGYESPDAGQMTACGLLPITQPEAFRDCKVQELASKEVIMGARQEIKAMLTKGLSQETPKLDATLNPERFVRK
ncbi:NHLP-related RiPP peptide [Lysobacter sp. TAF61]|uniref:NHLP-related RiPP peptide n=1 Tax=Lysobacter sp. TAF61 TaxID=3233072 RepID=UPI003F96C14A